MSANGLHRMESVGRDQSPSDFIESQTIGGIVSKETVCCVGGKVKH